MVCNDSWKLFECQRIFVFFFYFMCFYLLFSNGFVVFLVVVDISVHSQLIYLIRIRHCDSEDAKTSSDWKNSILLSMHEYICRFNGIIKIKKKIDNPSKSVGPIVFYQFHHLTFISIKLPYLSVNIVEKCFIRKLPPTQIAQISPMFANYNWPTHKHRQYSHNNPPDCVGFLITKVLCAASASLNRLFRRNKSLLSVRRIVLHYRLTEWSGSRDINYIVEFPFVL